MNVIFTSRKCSKARKSVTFPACWLATHGLQRLTSLTLSFSFQSERQLGPTPSTHMSTFITNKLPTSSFSVVTANWMHLSFSPMLSVAHVEASASMSSTSTSVTEYDLRLLGSRLSRYHLNGGWTHISKPRKSAHEDLRMSKS